MSMKKVFLLAGILLLTAGSVFAYTMPRWGMTSVDVYIEEHEYSNAVQRAFEAWSQASNGKLRFRFYTTRFASNNAPIKVSFIDEQAPYYITRSKRQETTGYFTNMEDGYINAARVQIYTKTREKRPVTSDEVYNSMLLEVGYILGLEKMFGQCDPPSVMCMDSVGQHSSLTERDRKMIIEKYERSSNDIKEMKSNKNKNR